MGFRTLAVALLVTSAAVMSCAPPAPTAPPVAPVTVGPDPSAASLKVCNGEAQEDSGVYLGSAPTSTDPPTWVDHQYGCRWEYPTGSIGVSVKELSTPEEATAWAGRLVAERGPVGPPVPLGDGAFATSDGSMVMRRDTKVLLVDVSRLPPMFGDPPSTPDVVAQQVTAVIAQCWTGG